MSGNFYNKYPYTDFHELNLDWILKEIKETEKKVDDFTVFNTLTWAGEWDASKSYVKWSIVQNADGNGFICIKAVPPNVDLSNREYWKQVANYEALYAAFNQRITTLEADTSLINSKLLVNNIVKGKKILCLGDSYGTGYSPEKGDVWNDGWISQLESLLGDSNTYYHWATGGTGFSTARASGGFSTVIKDLDFPSDLDYVIVCSGRNDAGQDHVNVQNGFSSFTRTIREKAPNAVVYIGYIAQETKNFRVKKDIADMHREYWIECLNNGLTFIPDFRYTLRDSLSICSDGIHPTAEGNKIIAQQLVLYLNGKSITSLYNIDLSITPESGITASDPTGFKAQCNGATSTIFHTKNTFNRPEGFSGRWSGDTSITLGTFTDNMILMENTYEINSHYETALIYYTPTSGTAIFKFIPCRVEYTNQLKVYPYILKSDNSDYDTTTINEITLLPTSFVINTF